MLYSAAENNNKTEILPCNLNYKLFLKTINNSNVFYQPILDLVEGTFVGYETLIRPKIPESSTFEEFISFGYEHKFIPRITEVVLKNILSYLEIFNISEFPIVVTVNVSPECLEDQAICDLVNFFLYKASQNISLVMELSECTEFSISLLDCFLKKVAFDKRISFAIDDFGVGNARFNIIGHDHVNWIKIDKSLMPKDPSEMRGMEILSSTISFCKKLGKMVVLEGIETLKQIEIASEMPNVDFVQGYFIARPNNLEEVLGSQYSHPSSMKFS